VLIALFGLLFLGERLGPASVLAILVATAGVMLMSMPARAAQDAPSAAGRLQAFLPAGLGIASGAMFALSAVGFRGAIVALGEAPFHVRATTTLAATLAIQTVLLTAWLLARDRRVLAEIFRAWRPSLLAGATGAFASQMWFLAFSLQTAAAVRTLGLVEIVFAQAASRRLFSQRLGRREALGIALMVAGLALLLHS
jgi:drug/metabolite transporter (DMT)-like permease